MRHEFAELARAARGADEAASVPVMALVGDCSTQYMAMAIRGESHLRGRGLRVLEMGYDQVESMLLDASSPLYEAHPSSIVIALCTQRLYERFQESPLDERPAFAEVEMERIRALWNAIRRNCDARIVQLGFPEYDDRVFGDLAVQVSSSFIYQLRELNAMLAREGASRARILDVQRIQAAMGCEAFFDPRLYYQAKFAFSPAACAAIAAQLCDMVEAMEGLVRKCVVVDLDDTLWGGVLADVGVSGIEVGELGRGPAFLALQRWLKELSRRGVLLVACSKNDEEVAQEPFLENPAMALRLEDFALFVANWRDKASNIRDIRATLDIAMDSIVFVDNSPFERELVRSLLPEVTVPELPDDPARYVDFLEAENLFETASWSSADAERTSLYRAQHARAASEAAFDDVDAYLESLDMHCRVAPFDALSVPRIAQLSQRSNQFNLRTVRYGEDEVAALVDSDDSVTLAFQLSDRFGDQGLVSYLIAREGLPPECARRLRLDATPTLFVDSWVMSCRVLRRGLECFAINELVHRARNCGYRSIVGEYVPTKKNNLVAAVYEQMGFRRAGDGLFVLDVDEFEELPTHVRGERL